MLLLLLGCLDHTPVPGGVDNSVFVAMQSHFADFRSWTSFSLDGEIEGHSGTERMLFVSALPAEGASVFPVGTMIVKSAPVGESIELHAMAKRGGDYNPGGAPGWEWFELKESAGIPVILWRGEEPPSGEGYVVLGGEDTAVDGDCNSCHQAAYDNDYVHEVPL